MSGGFSFGFSFEAATSPAPTEEAAADDEPAQLTEEAATDEPVQPTTPRKPYEWIDMEPLWDDRLQAEIVYQDIPLSNITTRAVEDRPLRKVDESYHYEFKDSDLVPGVYEGGRKIWECTWDLLEYLVEEDLSGASTALELGCGHGLPCCYLLRAYPTLKAVLTDYNDTVLKDVTISSLVINVEKHADRIALGAGDWMELAKNMTRTNGVVPSNGRFDVILAAETLYTKQSARETALLLGRHLTLETGVAYIATKRYYFGVGGGTDAFTATQLEEGRQMEVETARVWDSGTGNIRELLKVRIVGP